VHRSWLVVIATILVGCRAAAPSIAKDDVPSASPRELCLLAANDCTAAILSSDQGGAFEPDKIVGCTPPEAIARAGGRDKVIATRVEQRRSYDKMRSHLSLEDRAFGMKHVENGLPALVDGGSMMTFAIVPSTITVDLFYDTRVRERSFMLGVSTDGGRSWRFVSSLVNGSRALTRASIQEMFAFPESAHLPASTDTALVDADGAVLAVPDPKTGKWPWAR
jgi:hypothetical protein